jgi:PKD repeat protein
VSGEQAADVLGNPRVDDPGSPNTNAEGPRPYADLGAYEFQGSTTPPPPSPSPPTASLTVSPQSGTAPLAVTADASASTDPQGQALSYRFDFGDGSTAGPQPGTTATHTFTAAGTYTVKVTVTDTAGLTDSASHVVGVTDAQPAPSAPTARLSVSPQSGTAPLAVTADASASTDPQGQALSYRFDFGDGSTAGPQPGTTATHTFTAAGTYTVKVTVTDTAGLTDSASQVVTVDTGSPPTANPPAFVASIANNYSTSTKTSGYITVWRSEGVAAGDVAVLTVQLAATSPTGPVSGTDAAGNTYTTAADVSDGSGNRLLVLTGVVLHPLVAGDKITVTFPSATGYRIGGDEFTGVTTAGTPSAATGVAGSFSSGAAGASAGDLVFGAVSIPSGTGNPTWSAGWTNLGSYAVGSRYLGRAYEAASAAGGYAASGTASGNWLAAAVSLRP